jgi:hypothetical protein
MEINGIMRLEIIHIFARAFFMSFIESDTQVLPYDFTKPMLTKLVLKV